MQASLALVSPGQHGVVTRIGGSRSLRVRLMELGLLPGTAVQVIGKAPLGDPMHLNVRGCHLSIRRGDAARILVRLEQQQHTPTVSRGRAA